MLTGVPSLNPDQHRLVTHFNSASQHLCPAVSASEPLVEHALRQTLVADALSLQFKLPPPGEPAPAARSSAAVAGGSPVVDAVAVTSVWAVHLLRTLCQVGLCGFSLRGAQC